MSSYRSDRTRGGRLPVPKPATMDNLSQKRSPALTQFGSAPSRSFIPAPAAYQMERRNNFRPTDREEEQLTVPPMSKTSRSMSSDDGVRPSGLPRFAGGPPSHRRPSAPALTSNRPDVSSPAMGNRDRPRNVLRRKANFRRQNEEPEKVEDQPIVDNSIPEVSNMVSPAQYNQPEYGIGNSPQGPPYQDNSSNTASKLPGIKNHRPTESVPVRQIPKELIGLRTVVNTSNLPPPPPTPNFASASSPSTRYSGSPGMWSSRDSTPTSLSSYSPGITQPASYRFKQQSPSQGRQVSGMRMTTTPVSQIDIEEPTMLGPIADDPYARPGRAESSSIRKTEEPSPLASPPVMSPDSQGSPNDSIEENKHNANNAILENVSDASPSIEVLPTQNSKGSFKPRRPSRDGTDNLEQTVLPVIRSNLPALRLNTSQVQLGSTDKSNSPERLRVTPVKSAAASVESLQSNVSTQKPARNDAATHIPRKASRTLIKPPKETKIATNASSMNMFGVFNTKSKTNLSAKANSAEKSTRKGPAAGTGHEGYGKYAHRGRKSSVSSSNDIRARSTSTSGGTSISSSKSSNRQESDIDDFFLERLEPVVISGGGMDRDQLFRTQSEQSLSSLSVTSASASSTVTTGPIMGGYSSDSSADQMKPASRFFNSETNLPSQLKNKQPVKPKITRNESAPAQVSDPNSTDSGRISRISEDSNFSLPTISKATSKSDSSSSTITSKSKPSRKWNFFHRSQKNEPKKPVPTPDESNLSTAQLTAQVSALPKSRPIAHYALLDADSDSLEDILHRVEESPPSEDDDELFLKALKRDLTKPGRHGTSVLLPSPPAAWKEFNAGSVNAPQNRPASPKVFFQKTDQNTQKEGKRRSRLTPVGRIPHVVSRRDKDHKPTPNSYSRPFSRDEAPSLTITAGPGAPSSHDRLKLNMHTDSLSQGPFYKVPGSAGTFGSPVLSESAKFMSNAYNNNEFLHFSPGKQSEVSMSTSEGDSIMATVASMGLRPDTTMDEEDIWAEYDELLDNMLSPGKETQPKPKASFESARKASKTLQAEISASDATPNISVTSDTLEVADATSANRSSDASIRLRRSKIATALHSSMSPTSHVSYSELIEGYSERNKTLSDFISPDSPAESSQNESRPQSVKLQSPTPTNTPDFETTRRRNTLLFDMAERIREGAAAQTNLRSASLMTSRWLSFGRVLFSPAHNRIQKNESERILILDGLGNDDWSYYCALTYPDANIFNLSIRSGSSSSSSPHPDAWRPPVNHHIVHNAGGETAFPFPKGFFSACVLRFPAASSEDGQRHILSECKRVLRPGGYLEMSVLDLDLVNMGSRTRKAVRSLKEKIYLADSDISLKPASDNIQRLLGVCGFDNLNRCMVSLPVAGMIRGSSGSGSTGSSNKSSDLPSAGTGVSSQPSSIPTGSESQPHSRTPSDETEPSLGDLLSDPSPSASNDESITKVVARVGRWWYTRCYEIPVLSDPSTDQSIWSERKILRECQKMGTGFRLLIAYAQKPNEKRRTVSL